MKQYHTHESKRRLRYSHSFVYIQTNGAVAIVIYSSYYLIVQ